MSVRMMRCKADEELVDEDFIGKNTSQREDLSMKF